jgi:hypothetical protein
MLGQKADADRLQAIIERHVKAFGDPARVEALFLALL